MASICFYQCSCSFNCNQIIQFFQVRKNKNAVLSAYLTPEFDVSDERAVENTHKDHKSGICCDTHLFIFHDWILFIYSELFHRPYLVPNVHDCLYSYCRAAYVFNYL